MKSAEFLWLNLLIPSFVKHLLSIYLWQTLQDAQDFRKQRDAQSSLEERHVNSPAKYKLYKVKGFTLRKVLLLKRFAQAGAKERAVS